MIETIDLSRADLCQLLYKKHKYVAKIVARTNVDSINDNNLTKVGQAKFQVRIMCKQCGTPLDRVLRLFRTKTAAKLYVKRWKHDDLKCGTCGEIHVVGKYYNHNFVKRLSHTH